VPSARRTDTPKQVREKRFRAQRCPSFPPTPGSQAGKTGTLPSSGRL
jgi:hypothetical protein